MSGSLPPPRCACGHVYGVCPTGSRCTFKYDEDDEDSRCGCPGFRVPGPGRVAAERAKAKRKREAKATPWWR